jgi:hypothetical protein
MLNPRKLIEKIKEVDERLDGMPFPCTFVLGLCQGKEWEDKFWRMLSDSDVRTELKKELLKRKNERT